MINIEQLLDQHLPQLNNKPLLRSSSAYTLKKLLRESDFIEFGQQHPDLYDLDFVEQVLMHFNFSYAVKHNERENIPATGRVLIVANHPLGSLDALALLQAVSDVRSDVKIIANQLLMQLTPLQNLLLPVNNMTGNTDNKKLQAIHEYLEQEGAVIIFPAGEVSRLGKDGVTDKRWRTGFLHIANQACCPIVPVHIAARNSALFYGLSSVFKPLSSALLVQEMFKQHSNSITLTIGRQIPYSAYHDLDLSLKDIAHLFKRHTYAIGKGKKPTLKTEASIALPEKRSRLRQELNQCEVLGRTQDGKDIYLYHYQKDAAVMREIGRLREIAFRAVGEGSGKRRDIDHYDKHYAHIVLWDNQDLEIVGAYRMQAAKAAIEQGGIKQLYSASLFHFNDAMTPYLEQGLELGRSFVQPRYWGKRSLDYLWMGIGAYLSRHPEYRYLFGPVSISNSLPDTAKALLVHYYKLYYSPSSQHAVHKLPYEIPSDAFDKLKTLFKGDDASADFKQLKSILGNMGTAVPTLYKQYTELCEPGGVQFIDFGIDPEFADCIDGLVMVDIQQLKAKKRARYIDAHQLDKA